MAELRAGGTTILLATHDMAEAEKMADRVAILLRGRIVATGTPRELTATGAGLTKISVRTEDARCSCARTGVASRPCSSSSVKETTPSTTAPTPARPCPPSWPHLRNRGDRLIDLRVERPSLEERFLEITAHREAPR